MQQNKAWTPIENKRTVSMVEKRKVSATSSCIVSGDEHGCVLSCAEPTHSSVGLCLHFVTVVTYLQQRFCVLFLLVLVVVLQPPAKKSAVTTDEALK